MLTSQITIRPFTEDDFPHILAVMQAAQPDIQLSVDFLSHLWHSNRNTEQKLGWLVAIDPSDQIVGSGFYFGQAEDTLEEQSQDKPLSTFMVFCYVYPHLQNQGLGTHIYEQVVEVLKPYAPLRLRTDTSADQTQALHFLHNRGFVEIAREHMSRIDLSAFDEAQFASDLDRVAEQGITIKSVAELAEDPERDEKLYALGKAIHQDLPGPGEYPSVEPSFEQWQQNVWKNPHLLPHLWFVALDGQAYIGECSFKSTEGDGLEVGLTGVLPTYRKRGIATAVKVHALQRAKTQGYPTAETASHMSNLGMININLRLGFVQQPDFIEFEKMVMN